MKIKNLIAVSILIATAVFGQNKLTLNEVINNVLTNQPLITEAKAKLNEAEAKIQQSGSYYYPVVNGNLSYTRIGPIPEISFGGSGFELAPANNYDMNISASELVYDFGRRDAFVELAKSYKLSAKDNINLIRNNLTYQAIQSFYTILFIEKSLKVNETEMNDLKEHLDITSKKVKSGSATDFDILTTKVRLSSVENSKIDLENRLEKTKIYLRSLMGWDADKSVNIEGEITDSHFQFNKEELIENAFQKRLEIKLAEDAVNSATLNKNLSLTDERPMLNVFAKYGFKNGYEPNLDVLRGNWVAGVSASIPIFNGNIKDAKIAEAEANLKGVSAKIPQLKRSIKAEVENAVQDYQSNRIKFNTAKLQVEQAKQAVERAKISYKNGVITNLELIDAETNLSEAELQYARLLYQNMLYTYEVNKAVGEKLWKN